MKTKVKLLIEFEGRLLVLKPLKKKKRTLIGGTVDFGESSIDAAIREAYEEAGIILYRDDLEIHYSCFGICSGKIVLLHCYLIRDKFLIHKLNESHKFQAIEWVPIQKGLNKLKGVEKYAANKLIKTYLRPQIQIVA